MHIPVVLSAFDGTIPLLGISPMLYLHICQVTKYKVIHYSIIYKNKKLEMTGVIFNDTNLDSEWFENYIRSINVA